MSAPVRQQAPQIIGAGPAGFAAAVTLARAGRRVLVHQTAAEVGSRFQGDHQGLENWTTNHDVLDDFRDFGLTCDVEALRPHYALTLRHWVSRLEARKKEAIAHVNETTYRVWRLYMAACALQFEHGAVGVYQILAANRREGFIDVPLTRHDIYRRNRQSTV